MGATLQQVVVTRSLRC